MQSKPLKQAINLALDTLGMQGPVSRRQVAEQVLKSTSDQHWAYGDLREARLAFLQTEIAAQMKAPHGDHIVDQYLSNVPPEHYAVLSCMPRFICINPRGGINAKHVMSIFATREQWAANIALKDYIAEKTAASSDAAKEVYDLLTARKATCLSDLFKKQASTSVRTHDQAGERSVLDHVGAE